MADPVFANSMQISSKAMGGKSICQFPDVCFTPPQTPATPPGVPIPYPNTGLAGDTSDGSRSVKIGGEEIMLKNRSAFKTSTGDEAGAAPKKGLINSKTKGKVYFLAWSMDVKVEGENVVRNLDLTTHNHACDPANGAVPTVHAAAIAALQATDNCGGDAQKVKDNCKEDCSDQCPGALAFTVTEQKAPLERSKKLPGRTIRAGEQATADAEGSACVEAMRCFLRPYSPRKDQQGCCPGQSAHHIPPRNMMEGVAGYSPGQALCVCLEGATQHTGSHGKNHAAIDYLAKKPGVLKNGRCSVSKYNEVCAKAVAAQCGCSKECIENQLNDSFTSKQKDKQVKHWESNSKQLGDLGPELDKIHVAPPAPPIPGF